MFRWYVINTYSGHENKVKANLEHRIVSMNQSPRFRRVIVPAASGAPLERVEGLSHLMQVQEVEDIRQHRLYQKTIRRTTRLKAHDEQNSASAGDLVRLAETRPRSATKRWRVVEIIQKAK